MRLLFLLMVTFLGFNALETQKTSTSEQNSNTQTVEPVERSDLSEQEAAEKSLVTTIESEGSDSNRSSASQNILDSDDLLSSPKVTVSEASNWPFVMLTLLGMVACILLIAFIVKRFTGLTGMGSNDLKVVSAMAIGTRERVAVLDVRGEQFLIGVTSQQISLLHHFDEAPIKPSVSAKPSEFAEKLQSIISKQSSKGSE